jgi:hypothetical protein
MTHEKATMILFMHVGVGVGIGIGIGLCGSTFSIPIPTPMFFGLFCYFRNSNPWAAGATLCIKMDAGLL